MVARRNFSVHNHFGCCLPNKWPVASLVSGYVDAWKDQLPQSGKFTEFGFCIRGHGKALCHEGVWGSGGISPAFLTSPLDGGEWSASLPGKEPTVPIG
jgi:hypothetical protein